MSIQTLQIKQTKEFIMSEFESNDIFALPKRAFHECAAIAVMLRKKFPDLSIQYGEVWCVSTMAVQEQNYRAVFCVRRDGQVAFFDVTKKDGKYRVSDFEISGEYYKNLGEAIKKSEHQPQDQFYAKVAQ
jgi:hypothetical protein